MVKNNHQLYELERNLLEQDFLSIHDDNILERCKNVAAMYANLEGSIAVLSDLSTNKSYIYNGVLATKLGMKSSEISNIDSIWEEEIYNHIHPDDMAARNLLEVYFFMLLKKTPIEQRHNFCTFSTLRMRDHRGEYIPILHRVTYLRSQDNGSLWLALCLYNFSFDNSVPQPFKGVIQNRESGDFVQYNNEKMLILTDREIEVLKLIECGSLSKEIALTLGLSINTINRHRQNIIEKLRVNSSVEAIRKAREMRIIV